MANLFFLNESTTNVPSFIQTWSEMVLPALGQEILAHIAFAVYVLFLLGGGLVAVLARTLVRALIGLVVTFLGVAGMYLLMASPFMAFMQLLIYIGAICILIFFAIMLVNNTASGEERQTPSLCQLANGALAALASLVLFGPVIALNAESQAELPTETPLASLGEGLLSYYVVPFELISIVLLVAMAGGVFLAWDKRFKAKD